MKRVPAYVAIVAFTALASSCSRADQPSPSYTTAPTVTIRETVTATPTPTPEEARVSEFPVPFAAVVSIASLNVEGTEVTIAGYVQGVVENDGVCTFVATPTTGSAAVEATRAGIDNVSTTSCGTVTIPASEFSRGSWNVTLNYVSPQGGATTSDPLPLEIP